MDRSGVIAGGAHRCGAPARWLSAGRLPVYRLAFATGGADLGVGDLAGEQ